MLQFKEFKTSFGPLSVIFDEAEGQVIRSGFFNAAAILQKEYSNADIRKVKDIIQVKDALEAWQDKELNALNQVPCSQPGSAFAQSCFNQMRKVTAGRTISYAQLAAKSKNPKAIRAAASCCANNRLAPFVPCHRIIRSTGEIGNYAFGKPLKLALLRHEGAID